MLMSDVQGVKSELIINNRRRQSKSLKGFKNSNTLNQCLFIKDVLCEHGG